MGVFEDASVAGDLSMTMEEGRETKKGRGDLAATKGESVQSPRSGLGAGEGKNMDGETRPLRAKWIGGGMGAGHCFGSLRSLSMTLKGWVLGPNEMMC